MIGIDFGYSSTKVVVMDRGKLFRKLLLPPGVAVPYIKSRRINITGGKSRFMKMKAKKVSEIDAIAKGAAYLSKKKKFLVASIGTGTCIVNYDKTIKHTCGSGLGGGTILGLGKLLVGTTDVSEIENLASRGNLDNVDLRIKDIVGSGIGNLKGSLTASNFSKLRLKRKTDLAVGIINLVAEGVGVLIGYAAKANKQQDVVIVGRTINIPQFRKRLSFTLRLFKLNVIFPKDAEFATAIGATL
ncbi:hypothetical protein JXA85_06330 [Candidatus Woesearchaeota archaeon]|nr:hypothetical protein [Candidatus Woesearchaeota archaeon]